MNKIRSHKTLSALWPFGRHREKPVDFEHVHLPDDGKEFLKPPLKMLLQELEGASAPQQKEAGAHFRMGEERFKNWQYRDAAESYQASYEVFESLSALLARGVALMMVSELKEAAEVFEKGRNLSQTPACAKADRREATRLEAAFGINLGQVYFDLGKPDLPFKALKKARNILTRLPEQNLTAVVLRQLGMLMFMQGNYDKGLSDCELVDTLDKQKRDTLNEVRTLLVKSLLLFGKGKLEDSKKTLERGLNILGSPNTHTKARLLLQLAHFYLSDNNGYDSKQLGEEALQIFQEISDERGTSRCLSFLAIFDFSNGRYDEGIKKLNQARQLDRITSYRRGEIRLLVVQGKFYFQQGNIEEANHIFQEADQIAQDIGHIPALLETSSLFAATSSFILPSNDSLDILEDCLIRSRSIPIPEREIDLCHQISSLCLTQGRISDALDFCQQAIERSQKIGNSLCEAKSYIALSQVLSQTGDEIGATEHLGFAQAILQHTGFKIQSANHMV